MHSELANCGRGFCKSTETFGLSILPRRLGPETRPIALKNLYRLQTAMTATSHLPVSGHMRGNCENRPTSWQQICASRTILRLRNVGGPQERMLRRMDTHAIPREIIKHRFPRTPLRRYGFLSPNFGSIRSVYQRQRPSMRCVISSYLCSPFSNRTDRRA